MSVEASERRRGWLGAWFRFLGSEIALIYTRRRNQVGLTVLAAVPVLIAVALRVSRPHRGGAGSLITSVVDSGLYVPIAALGLEMTFFLPLAMAMLSGDAIAGEANIGTLRYLLTVPAGRSRLLVTKLAALVVGALTGVVTVVAVGLAVGVLVFGARPMLTLSGTQLSVASGLWRIVLAGGYLTAMMIAIAAIGLFVSTLTEQPMAATIATMIIVTGGWIVEGVSQLSWLAPWLITHWFGGFLDVLRDPLYTTGMVNGLGVALGYLVVFGSAAWARLTSMDVTS